MPAFDASIMRGAWESDGNERSGPDWQDIAVAKQLRLSFQSSGCGRPSRGQPGRLYQPNTKRTIRNHYGFHQ